MNPLDISNKGNFNKVLSLFLTVYLIGYANQNAPTSVTVFCYFRFTLIMIERLLHLLQLIIKYFFRDFHIQICWN